MAAGRQIEGQMNALDFMKRERRRPCEYDFFRYIGQRGIRNDKLARNFYLFNAFVYRLYVDRQKVRIRIQDDSK